MDKSPKRAWQPPAAAGGSREQCSKTRRTCALVTFGRSQVSPPVLAAAKSHGSLLWPHRLAPLPAARRPPQGGAAKVPPAAVPSGAPGCARGSSSAAPGPHASPRPRAAGIPASGQTLLINRRTRRSRRQPAFIFARRGGPEPAPCPRGRPPHGPLLSRDAEPRAHPVPPGAAAGDLAPSYREPTDGWRPHWPDLSA